MSDRVGYSLIELLIVVTLVAIISLTATSFLFSSLSGEGKASGLAAVKQNGDHAIGVIERASREASGVDCPTPSSLTITNAAGVDATFSIVSSRITSTTTSDVYLTSDQIVAENFTCSLTSGSVGNPDVVLVSFQLRLGDPSTDRPEEVAVERFQTRVALRTY
jgi:prepilin-type N-terminal cleavage/methylation domain-containing protein